MGPDTEGRVIHDLGKIPVIPTERPFAGSSLGHCPQAKKDRIKTNLVTEHLTPLPGFPPSFTSSSTNSSLAKVVNTTRAKDRF